MANICQVQWLGRMEYEAASQLQQELIIKRIARESPNMLLLLEHPHTFSVGLGSRKELLLTDPAELRRLNIAYHEVNRGGPVMYHGPGQLVAYPILSLRECGYNYHSYVEALETVVIRALRAFRLHAFRQPGQRGVWVLPGQTPYYAPRWGEADEPVAKLGFIGTRVDREDITSYGFYINVSPDLNYFDMIMPRGVSGCNMTSLERVLNKSIKIGDVIQPVIQSFCDFFEFDPLVKGWNLTPVLSEATLTPTRELA